MSRIHDDRVQTKQRELHRSVLSVLDFLQTQLERQLRWSKEMAARRRALETEFA